MGKQLAKLQQEILQGEGTSQGAFKVEKMADGTFRVFIDFPEERAAFKLSKQQALTIAEFIIFNTQEVENG